MPLPEEAKEILTPIIERLALLIESELPASLGSATAATGIYQARAGQDGSAARQHQQQQAPRHHNTYRSDGFHHEFFPLEVPWPQGYIVRLNSYCTRPT